MECVVALHTGDPRGIAMVPVLLASLLMGGLLGVVGFRGFIPIHTHRKRVMMLV